MTRYAQAKPRLAIPIATPAPTSHCCVVPLARLPWVCFAACRRQFANSFVRTSLQSLLAADGMFRSDMPAGLVVRVQSIGGGSAATAAVTVCRASGTSENQGGASCFDGRDNDCDGLAVSMGRVWITCWQAGVNGAVEIPWQELHTDPRQPPCPRM